MKYLKCIKEISRMLSWMFLLSLFMYPGMTRAQETGKSNWHYLAEIYLMLPNMSGDILVAPLPPVEVDADAGDILGHIRMGAMAYFEATNDDWSISSDLLYMKLGQEVVQRNLLTGGDVIMKQTAWELAGFKKIIPYLEVGLGGKLVAMTTEVTIETNNETRDGSASVVWYDPVILLRSQGTVKDKWILQFRGDIGGFGVGSDFSWQLQANAGYRFSKLFQATIGYRYISIEYDEGSIGEKFIYDVDTYGIVTRFGFNF